MKEILLYGSMFLGILSLTGTWFLSKKYRWAWLIYALERALCVPYDGLTYQWGFVILDATSVVIAIKAYFDWKNASHGCEHCIEESEEWSNR